MKFKTTLSYIPSLMTSTSVKYIKRCLWEVMETTNIKLFHSPFGFNLNEPLDGCACVCLTVFTTQAHRPFSPGMSICLSWPLLWFSADAGFLEELKSESLNICANIQLNTDLEEIRSMDLNQSLVIMQISRSTSNIRKRLFLGPHHFLK